MTYPNFTHRKKNKNSRSPLSYEEKLKREEREKLRKLKLRKKEEKKRKQKYYKENLKTKTIAKPKKTKKNQSSAPNQTEKKVEVHKNPIKRLWAWLNGKYDTY